MNKLKSKTIIAGIFVTIMGGAQAFVDGGVIDNPAVMGYITMGIGVVQMILRSVTNKPLSEK